MKKHLFFLVVSFCLALDAYSAPLVIDVSGGDAGGLIIKIASKELSKSELKAELKRLKKELDSPGVLDDWPLVRIIDKSAMLHLVEIARIIRDAELEQFGVIMTYKR